MPLVAVLAVAGCRASSGSGIRMAPGTGVIDPNVRPAAAPPMQSRFTAADVDFMQGMIPHHAQAVLIAKWAESHGANASVKILCGRIVVGQTDEIALMRNWLRVRNQRVPDADATHHRMTMNGMQHDMLMPGMLSDADLKQLDAARGVEWDRLFLTFMIKHHEGAVQMVDSLFASPGAAQDEDVYRLAADIYADQTSEIARMEQMLAALPRGGR
jgi:uncharacterized protein (DUF305 family)